MFVLKYFQEVVLPEMTANQITKQQTRGLENLLATFAESKSSLVEVCLFLDNFYMVSGVLAHAYSTW